ncbi:hypothetical protein [Variovorax defluvii]|uniref:hypothetical protein n=1 Tax=Variovorax defluvii TaxID=913761 RepID=UPI0031EB1AEE
MVFPKVRHRLRDVLDAGGLLGAALLFSLTMLLTSRPRADLPHGFARLLHVQPPCLDAFDAGLMRALILFRGPTLLRAKHGVATNDAPLGGPGHLRLLG